MPAEAGGAAPWLTRLAPDPPPQGLAEMGPWDDGTAVRGGWPPVDCGGLERELDATRSMRVPPPALLLGRCRESDWGALTENAPADPLHPLLLALLDRSMESLGSKGWMVPVPQRPQARPAATKWEIANPARLVQLQNRLASPDSQAARAMGEAACLHMACSSPPSAACGFTNFDTIKTVILLIAGKLDFASVNPHARQPARNSAAPAKGSPAQMSFEAH